MKTRLLKCATLLLGGATRSPFAEDHPKTMPKSAIREIEKQNEQLRVIAIELIEISKAL